MSRQECSPRWTSVSSSAQRWLSSSSCGASAWPALPPPSPLLPPAWTASSSSHSNRLRTHSRCREQYTQNKNLSYSSRAIIHSAAQSRALISVPFIAVVQEVMRLITDTHCIWFWSERSSSPSTCRWRGRGWRGSSSTAASRTPSCRSPGSGRRGGRSGWWSDRFSLCTWKQRKEGAGRDVETMSASNYTFIYDN